MVALSFRLLSANSGENSPCSGSPEVLAFEFSPSSGIHALVVNPHKFPVQECTLEKPFSRTVSVCGKVKYSVPLSIFFKFLKASLNFTVFLLNFEILKCIVGQGISMCMGIVGRRNRASSSWEGKASHGFLIPTPVPALGIAHGLWLKRWTTTFPAPAHLPFSYCVHLDFPTPNTPKVPCIFSPSLWFFNHSWM